MFTLGSAFRRMRNVVLPAAMAAAVAATPAKAITQDEANAIATEAYAYLYSLVTMDLTRRQSTNVDKVSAFAGPENMFVNVPAYPTADMKTVVRPNFDTLYSAAWLDLTDEPMVISVPNTDGRYYLLPMLDMWTDVFVSPGWRTTGTEAQTLLVAPPGWRPDVREKLDEKLGLPKGTLRVDAPTPYVWIIGRIKTDGPDDYDAVHKIQDGLKLRPLSEVDNDDWKPAPKKIDPDIDMKTPPKTQVDTMSGEKFFTYAAELLKLHPPHFTDQPIISRMERLGLVRGESFDFQNADPVVKAAITQAPKAAQELMAWKLPRLAQVVNYWSMNTDTMGVYGNYYLKRAIITQQGLGANVPEDAVYPLNFGDKDGKPLDGANNYTIHFEKDEIPPVDAFWSITLYDEQGFQVANPLNRFAVSNWMPFKYNDDGSLDLYFQNESPGKDKEANWLPAPKGPFNLTMRLYAPKSAALTGKWSPPPVTKAGAE